jgi:hypothetical protein
LFSGAHSTRWWGGRLCDCPLLWGKKRRAIKSRDTVRPEVFSGKPIIRHMRIHVQSTSRGATDWSNDATTRALGSSRRRGAGRLVGFGQRIGDFGQVKLPLLVDDQTQRWAFKSEIRKSPCPADKTLKLGIDEQALKAKDWLAIYLFEGPQEAIPTLPLKLYRTDDLYHTASPHP